MPISSNAVQGAKRLAKMVFLLQVQFCKSAVLMFLERETPNCTWKPFFTTSMKERKQKSGISPAQVLNYKVYIAQTNKPIL